MEISLPKKILFSYINKISDRCSFLYGLNSNFLKSKMNMINDIVITDELENYTPMAFLISQRIIKINKNYCEFDIYGHPISFVKSITDNQYHSLVHELLHAASMNSYGCGIPYPSLSGNIGLNEGITQMMADDICGYVENKFLNSYNDLKIIAKIIRTTFGNNVVCDSYFKGSNALVKALNESANSYDYYDKLNAKLCALNTLNIELFDKTNRVQAEYDIYSKKLNIIYKDIIINIVIPKLKTLNKEEKKKYITSLMYDIGQDDRIKNEIKTILSKYIDLTDDELSYEKFIIEEELSNIEKEDEFVSIVKDSKNNLSRVFVSRTGKVTLLGSPNKTITSNLECKTIYTRLFKSKYPNFNSSDAYKYLGEIKKGKPLNVRYNDILDRRVIYCGIQKALFDIGYLLLNDYTEFDNSISIKPVLVHRGKDITFNDLKLVASKYSLFNKIDGEHDYNFSICDRETSKKQENLSTIDLAMFTSIWLHSVTGELKYDDSAFSEENKNNYHIVVSAMKEAYNKTNNFDMNYMDKYCYTKESKELLKKLLSTPFKVEVCFKYILTLVGNSEIYQEYKGKSYNNLIDSNYDYNVAINDANDILKY